MLDPPPEQFGLPQTRSRYYMFAWRVDAFPGIAHREIGERWVELVEAMHVRTARSLSCWALAVPLAALSMAVSIDAIDLSRGHLRVY